MRLHNRQTKATFWTDPDVLQWPREKRWFYAGLWHLADDSGCLEDSPFAFKLQLFPSPIDLDITVDMLVRWRDELVHDKKLVPYEVSGKRCLFMVNFHKHQSLRSPGSPETPLPSWVKWVESDKERCSGKYVVSEPYGDLKVRSR